MDNYDNRACPESVQKSASESNHNSTFYTLHSPLFIIRMHRIVGGEVQSAALFALYGPASDEVAHVDHVSKFADIL